VAYTGCFQPASHTPTTTEERTLRTQREADLEEEIERLQARVDALEGVGRELINALDDERISDLTHLYERLDGLLAIKALEGEGK